MSSGLPGETVNLDLWPHYKQILSLVEATLISKQPGLRLDIFLSTTLFSVYYSFNEIWNIVMTFTPQQMSFITNQWILPQTNDFNSNQWIKPSSNEFYLKPTIETETNDLNSN